MKKWFISYICVLIVPFVLGCLLYAYSQDSVQSEIDTIQELNLQRIQTVVEDAVQNARNISEALLCDEKVALLMNLPEGAGYSEAGLVQEITGTIRNYQTANHLFSSIYICMTEQEILLSESACYRYDWVASVSEKFFGVDYEQFLSLMQEENYHHFFLTGTGEECGGIYVHSSWRYQKKQASTLEPAPILEPAPVVVLIRYNIEEFSELLTLEDYLTCLYDVEKGCLFSAGEWPEQPETLLQKVLAGENKDYYLLQEELPGTEIQVVNLIEKERYRSPIRRMQYTLFIYIFFCLAAGGAIAWYMARKQYSPVRELADMAEQVEQRFYGGEQHGDEFSLIKASMERLVQDYLAYKNIESEHQSITNEYQSMTNKYENIANEYKSIASEYKSIARKNEQYAKEMLLARFLQERTFGRQEVFQAYELLRTLFDGQKILLLAYEIEEQEEQETDSADGEALKQAGEPGSLADRLELPFFVLKNITEELITGRYAFFSLECGGMLLCFFGIPENLEKEAISDIRNISEQVCTYAGEYFHYTMVADISMLHENGQDVIQAYQEVMELVNFRDMIGSPLLALTYGEFYQDIGKESAEYYRQIQRLLHFVRKQQLLEAAELLDEMGVGPKEHHANRSITAEEKILTTDKAEKSENQPEEAKETEESEERINPEERMKELAAYIDSHYEDKNLTVGFLADRLGLSLSNLSQMFKRYRGCGLLDYINQVRVEQAKLLLLEGKTVKEAADLVGFYTTRPLTNLFNQLEGMTPMKWKNQKLKEAPKQKA